MGGLGLLSHEECAPQAYAAANALAGNLLAPLVPSLVIDEPGDRPSQRERCGQILATVRDGLVDSLQEHERAALVENASPLGRRWLSIIPYSAHLRVTNIELVRHYTIGHSLLEVRLPASDVGRQTAWDTMKCAQCSQGVGNGTWEDTKG